MLTIPKFGRPLQRHLASLGYSVVPSSDAEGNAIYRYDAAKEAEIQIIIDAWTDADEARYNALVELEQLDEYFTRPRVIEDAMRRIITAEHQAKIDRRDELRAIMVGA